MLEKNVKIFVIYAGNDQNMSNFMRNMREKKKNDEEDWPINGVVGCWLLVAWQGGGMGPAHDPHILWLQLAQSSFFLQRWERALDFFTRIVEGVSRVRI